MTATVLPIEMYLTGNHYGLKMTDTSDDSSSSSVYQHQPEMSLAQDPGILIYSQHKHLKTLTTAEQKQALKALPHHIQLEIKDKLAHVGPIAAIFFDNNIDPDTTVTSTINLKGMLDLQLQHKLIYRESIQRQLHFTLALTKDVQPYAVPLTQIYNSKHIIDTYKVSILQSLNPNHQCSECHHSYHKRSALTRHTKKRHPNKLKHSHLAPTTLPSDSSLQKETFQPPILEEACPSTYHIFWNLKAKTRQLPPDNKKVVKFVAPRFPLTMLQLAEQVNFPELLSKEFEVYAHAYDSIVKQKNFASINTVPFHSVGVLNSEHDLSLTGQTRILDSLKKKAPALHTKTLNNLTEATLTQFFFLARTYMLTSSIPWNSFSDYFLTKAVLGPEIHAKVKNALIGYPTHKEFLKNLSCFIERIIYRLLPVQESYYDAEVRILKKHKQYLTGPNPSIDFTKTYIHSDAQELTTKSPYYKQVHNDITDEQHMTMIENEKTNLLHKIITHTSYDAEIHKLLIASSKYKEITDVPNNELLDNVQSLIVAEEKSAVAFGAKLPHPTTLD